jgi:NAD(P)-dependent dehydrogenase (short-subunit alcohol dehydrogenase family)
MGATILVTGSSTGFGRLTVETLARQGHTVFAGIRDITGKNQTVGDELRALAENEQLALDVVVNNAGVSIIEPGTYPTANISANRRTPADQDRAALYPAACAA